MQWHIVKGTTGWLQGIPWKETFIPIVVEDVKVIFKFKRQPKTIDGHQLKTQVPQEKDSTTLMSHNRLMFTQKSKVHPNKATVVEAMGLSYMH